MLSCQVVTLDGKGRIAGAAEKKLEEVLFSPHVISCS